MMIKALSERGVYQKDIAEQLGVHPKTVSRALKRGRAPVRGPKPRASKLEPHKAVVDRLLREGVWNAVVILRELRAAGYAGGYTILRTSHPALDSIMAIWAAGPPNAVKPGWRKRRMTSPRAS